MPFFEIVFTVTDNGRRTKPRRMHDTRSLVSDSVFRVSFFCIDPPLFLAPHDKRVVVVLRLCAIPVSKRWWKIGSRQQIVGNDSRVMLFVVFPRLGDKNWKQQVPFFLCLFASTQTMAKGDSVRSIESTGREVLLPFSYRTLSFSACRYRERGTSSVSGSTTTNDDDETLMIHKNGAVPARSSSSSSFPPSN